MIRSLIANIDQNTAEVVIRRNLEPEALEAELANGTLMWIDIIDPTQKEIDWLAPQLRLNPAVIQDLQREDRRPALLVYPAYLFLSLFEPDIHLDRANGKEIHCLITDTCFVTVRQANAETVDEAYNRVVNNPDLWYSGVGYFLYLTAQFVIDAYYPLVDRISNQLNILEEKLLNGVGSDRHSRRSIYRIKQQLINLRQMVAPQREVLSNAIGEKRLAENGDTRDLLRHLYERLLRVYDVIDSQRDLSSNVLDMLQNQESRRMMEAVNRLTIFSMIFLPLTFFTGLFELNFATTSNPVVLPINGTIVFIAVVAAMLFSASAMIYVFRRQRWI